MRTVMILTRDVITLMYWHWRLQAIGHHVKQVQRPTYLHRKSLSVHTAPNDQLIREWMNMEWQDAILKARKWRWGVTQILHTLTHSTSMCWGTASDRSLLGMLQAIWTSSALTMDNDKYTCKGNTCALDRCQAARRALKESRHAVNTTTLQDVLFNDWSPRR
jgi:hypothetical protein